MKLIPMGSRILVEDIEATVDVVERGKQANLEIVLFEQNVPRPTEGLVVAVGSDPLLQEHLRIGDKVIFARYAGTHITVEGKTYRSLDFHEIITILREETKL